MDYQSIEEIHKWTNRAKEVLRDWNLVLATNVLRNLRREIEILLESIETWLLYPALDTEEDKEKHVANATNAGQWIWIQVGCKGPNCEVDYERRTLDFSLLGRAWVRCILPLVTEAEAGFILKGILSKIDPVDPQTPLQLSLLAEDAIQLSVTQATTYRLSIPVTRDMIRQNHRSFRIAYVEVLELLWNMRVVEDDCGEFSFLDSSSSRL